MTLLPARPDSSDTHAAPAEPPLQGLCKDTRVEGGGTAAALSQHLSLVFTDDKLWTDVFWVSARFPHRLNGCVLFPMDIKKALFSWSVSDAFTFHNSSDERMEKMG